MTWHVIYAFGLREMLTGRTILNRNLHWPRNRSAMDTGWETTLLISVTCECYSHSDARNAHVCLCVCSWGTGQVAARYDRDVTVGAVPPLQSKRPCICIRRTTVAMQDCLSICQTASFSQMSDSLQQLCQSSATFGNKTEYRESDRYKHTILLRI
jgi:hypothetical protein